MARSIHIPTLCLFGVAMMLFGALHDVPKSYGSPLVLVPHPVSNIRVQGTSASVSRDESSAVGRLLREFFETIAIEHDPESAYRRFVADIELSEDEKISPVGWNGFHETALRDLDVDTRARAFAAAWSYEYSAVILSMGLSVDSSKEYTSLEQARRIVDASLDTIRRRHHISEGEFYDALDFQYDDDPIVLDRKLSLLQSVFGDLNQELARRSEPAILRKNFDRIVASRHIEKRIVAERPYFIVGYAPALWFVCREVEGEMRIVAFGDEY